MAHKLDEDQLAIAALEAASRVWMGRAAKAIEVIAMAETFYTWLLEYEEPLEQR